MISSGSPGPPPTSATDPTPAGRVGRAAASPRSSSARSRRAAPTARPGSSPPLTATVMSRGAPLRRCGRCRRRRRRRARRRSAARSAAAATAAFTAGSSVQASASQAPSRSPVANTAPDDVDPAAPLAQRRPSGAARPPDVRAGVEQRPRTRRVATAPPPTTTARRPVRSSSRGRPGTRPLSAQRRCPASAGVRSVSRRSARRARCGTIGPWRTQHRCSPRAATSTSSGWPPRPVEPRHLPPPLLLRHPAPDIEGTPHAGATRTTGPRSQHPPQAGQGQWALGYREPLNPNERSKKDDDPLNVRQRILDIYSRRGFASIDPADLRGRFRWMGLYTQRRQGIPGGQTATLEPEELEDEFFMMRIRIDGGALTSEQLRVVARHLDHVRPRRRRRQRPAERPAALDPDRGRPGRSGTSSRRSA